MKLFYALVILLFSYSCSFDNKTGIWKNENIIIKDQTNQFEDFKRRYKNNNYVTSSWPGISGSLKSCRNSSSGITW